jgi:hypothetical protein
MQPAFYDWKVSRQHLHHRIATRLVHIQWPESRYQGGKKKTRLTPNPQIRLNYEKYMISFFVNSLKTKLDYKIGEVTPRLLHLSSLS